MSAPSLPRALVLLLSILAVALLSTCGGKDSTSPSPAPTGPTFNFTFTMTGTSHTLAFSEVGTWSYRCLAHGGMTGVVTVSAGSPNDSAVVQVGAGGALVFDPNNVTIKQNGTVRWVNVSSNPSHTVTR